MNEKKTLALLASLTLVSLVLLAAASLTAAQAPPQPPSGALAITFYAKTLKESQPVIGRNIVYSLRSVETNKKLLLSGVSGADGTITAYVDAGSWFVHAEIDLPETKGKDYAAAVTLKVAADANQTIYFQRVASAAGAVMDENNESIASALVEVNCLQDFYELKELNEETPAAARFETANAFRTDASGAFLLKFVPVGACTFTATTASNESVSQLVDLKEGEFASVALKIKRKLAAPFSSQLIWLALLALALLLVAWFSREYLKKKRGGREAKEAKRPPQKPAGKPSEKPLALEEKEKLKPTKKMRDVMNALSERERRVVEVLVAHDGKLKQSRIFRETLIPKTSLARALDSLERRNIVKLSPEGNSFLVELTEWFVSK